ncbi:MAG: substrate-binding domain-containing protein [Pirellulaceae bacterium]
MQVRLPAKTLSALPLLIVGAAMFSEQLSAEQPDGRAAQQPLVRCAVIGGLIDTGFWPALIERFEQHSGCRAALVSSGPKHVLAAAFERGDADLITMHSSDTIMNLAADGRAENPQPWARNDMILVGPPDDPAGVGGGKDAVAALRKIIESDNRLLLHGSLGANEVLADLLARGGLRLDPEKTISITADKQRAMLQRAAKERAYTLIGRIPYLSGKIESGDLAVMVQGDPRLRRPYVVATTTDVRDVARYEAARQLAAFLRAPETQAWIVQYGRGRLDDQPLFFPVTVPAQKPAPGRHAPDAK